MGRRPPGRCGAAGGRHRGARVGRRLPAPRAGRAAARRPVLPPARAAVWPRPTRASRGGTRICGPRSTRPPSGAPRAAVALTTAQALLREQRPEEALRTGQRRGGGAGRGQRADPRPARGDGGRRRHPGRAPRRRPRSGASARCAGGRTATRPRPASSWPSPRGRRPTATSPPRSASSSRAGPCRASPRPTPDPGDLPSTWFSLVDDRAGLGRALRRGRGAARDGDRRVPRRGRGGQPRDRAHLPRVARAAPRGPAAAEVDARTGVEAADLPLPLLYRLIATGILIDSARGAGRAGGGRPCARPRGCLGRDARDGAGDAPPRPRPSAHGAGADPRGARRPPRGGRRGRRARPWCRRASSRGARRPPWPT